MVNFLLSNIGGNKGIKKAIQGLLIDRGGTRKNRDCYRDW